MEPGATRTGSILHVGHEEELVRHAVADATAATADVTSVGGTDEARELLDGREVAAVIVETDLADWRTLLSAVDEHDRSLPSLVVVRDDAERTDAIAAGATDVFVGGDGDGKLLARRLENVLAATGRTDGNGGVRGSNGDGAERELSDLLLDTIDDIFYLIDPSGNLLRWNDTLADVTGYTDDEIARMEGIDLFAAEHQERIATAVDDVLTAGSATVEADIETADGERIPFHFTGAQFSDSDGELRGVVGIGRNVASRKERERELELAETVFDEAQDSIFVIDVDGEAFRIERVNPAYEKSTGIDAAAIEGERPNDVVGDGCDGEIEARYRECVAQQAPIEYEERLEIDGERRDWHTKLAPVVEDGSVVKLVGATRDVTDRKDLERELKEQANLLDHIFNQVPSALYVKDEEARFVRKRNFEGDPDGYVGKTDVEVFGDNEYARQAYADDKRVIKEGERIINKEEYNPLNDEWVLTSKVPWRDEDGDIQGLIGVSRHITEKKEYEQKLRLRNRAMEEAPIGITLLDIGVDGPTISYANSGFEALTGYDRSSATGGSFEMLVGSETNETAIADLESAFESGESTAVVSLLYRSDRTPFWGRVSVAPVTNGGGETTHFVGFIQDVTDEKEHEQNIERRLDEFGDVLAQQLRPPLDTARTALADGEVDEAAIERATGSIDRADQLIDDLAAVNTFSVKSREVSDSLTRSQGDDA